jgi:hypothetical protein
MMIMKKASREQDRGIMNIAGRKQMKNQAHEYITHQQSTRHEKSELHAIMV